MAPMYMNGIFRKPRNLVLSFSVGYIFSLEKGEIEFEEILEPFNMMNAKKLFIAVHPKKLP